MQVREHRLILQTRRASLRRGCQASCKCAGTRFYCVGGEAVVVGTGAWGVAPGHEEKQLCLALDGAVFIRY